MSARVIGRELRVDHSTVLADLAAPVPAGSLAAPERGNARALRSGCYSEAALAPVRERHAAELTARYPGLAPERVAVQAQRLAQVELGAAWLDDRGVVRDDEGRVFDIADKVAKWSAQAERWFEQVAAEHRPDPRAV